MDDQLILVEFQWKFSSAGEFISEVLSGVLFQPVRQLFRTDVTALSVIRTLSPSSKVSIACAPFTRLFRLPLYLAKRMEKEVIGMS